MAVLNEFNDGLLRSGGLHPSFEFRSFLGFSNNFPASTFSLNPARNHDSLLVFSNNRRTRYAIPGII